MSHRSRVAALVGFAIGAIAACSSSSSPSSPGSDAGADATGSSGGSSSGASSSSGSSSGGDAAATGFAVAGTLYDNTNNATLVGAAVCRIAAASACATTAPDGTFTLDGVDGVGSREME